MSKRSYKVWVEIEEFVNNQPQSGHACLPDSLGFFEGKHALRDAMAKVSVVVNAYGIDPENSDSVVMTKKVLNKKYDPIPLGVGRGIFKNLSKKAFKEVLKASDRDIDP